VSSRLNQVKNQRHHASEHRDRKINEKSASLLQHLLGKVQFERSRGTFNIGSQKEKLQKKIIFGAFP
jgi:hypothetical protein